VKPKLGLEGNGFPRVVSFLEDLDALKSHALAGGLLLELNRKNESLLAFYTDFQSSLEPTVF